jgi:hypothetical protein
MISLPIFVTDQRVQLPDNLVPAAERPTASSKELGASNADVAEINHCPRPKQKIEVITPFIPCIMHSFCFNTEETSHHSQLIAIRMFQSEPTIGYVLGCLRECRSFLAAKLHRLCSIFSLSDNFCSGPLLTTHPSESASTVTSFRGHDSHGKGALRSASRTREG